MKCEKLQYLVIINSAVLIGFYITAGYGFQINVHQNSYIDHIPINIIGDDQLLSIAESEGWVGDGSSNSPIVIENLKIVNSTNIWLIRVQDTTLHIEISNNYLDGVLGSAKDYGDGIWINNVENCKISGNTILENGMGISVEANNKNIIVENNIISQNNGAGIHLYSAVDVLIRNNTIYDNTFRETSSFISGNGLHISDSDNITLIKNTIYQNDGNGIHSTGSSIKISENTIENNNENGIYYQNIKDSNIDNNYFFNNTESGIILINSDGNQIKNNTFQSIGTGIQIESGSDNNIIEMNSFSTLDQSNNKFIVNKGNGNIIEDNIFNTSSSESSNMNLILFIFTIFLTTVIFRKKNINR
jgi:parallel beta-helix repeat protein